MYESADGLNALLEELARPPNCAAEIAERRTKCEQALERIKREEHPEQWARLQSEVGYCLARAPTESPTESLEQSIERYSAALEVYTAGAHPKAWARTQYRLASAHYALASSLAAGGQPALEATAEQLDQHLQKAIKHYEQAMTIWIRQERPQRWARLQESIADAYQARPRDREANLKEAIHRYEQALEVLDRSGHEAHWARIQHQMGTIWLRAMPHDRSEGLRKAIAHFKKALKVRQQTAEEQFQEWADTQLSLAMAYTERQCQDRAANITHAIELCEEVAQACQRKGHGELEGEARSTLADAYVRRIRGDRGLNLETAITHYQEAIGLQQGALRGRSLHNLGVAYTRRIRGDRLENLESAIQYYQNALDLLPQELLPIDGAALQRDLADAHWQLGRHWKRDDPMESERCLMKGIEHAEGASRIYTQQKLEAERAAALYIMGNLHAEWPTIARVAHLWEAISWYKQSLALRSPRTSPVEYAQTLNSLGVTYLELGLHARAIRHFEKAFDIHHKLGNREGERRVGANLALLHYSLHDWPKAHQALHRVLGVVESMRADALGDLGQVDIARENSRLYEMMIDTCLHLGPEHYGQALEAVEANKARAFLRELGAGGVPPPDVVPQRHMEVLEQERQLVEQVRRYEQAIHEAQDDREPFDMLLQGQDRARFDLLEIWKKLEPVFPNYVALRRGDPVRYGQVHELVDGMKNAALVEFYTRPEETIIFVMRSGHAHPLAKRLPLAEGDWGVMVQDCEFEMAGTDVGVFWQDKAVPLFTELLAMVQGSDLVYAVPHGPIHKLPIHAAKMGENHFGEQIPIAYAPSLSVLRRVVKRRSGQSTQEQSTRPLVLSYTSDPEEQHTFYPNAEKMANRLGRGAERVLGDNVTKALVRERAGKHRVLHFYGHGVFDKEDPMASGLDLADGRLTVRDIMELRLNTDLVCLSACQTGLSGWQAGDELLGLTRALLYAGASSVLVTLWRIDWEVALEFSVDFYERLYDEGGSKRVTKATALHQAMHEVRKKWDHPYYWAPFVLVGDWV